MIFISYRKRRSEPKGVMTPQKISKMQGIKAAFIKRTSALQKRFESQPEIKPLLAKVDRYNKIHEDLRKKQNASQFWPARDNVLVESTELSIEYLKKILQFCLKQNASHAVIKALKNKLTKKEQFLKELNQDS